MAQPLNSLGNTFFDAIFAGVKWKLEQSCSVSTALGLCSTIFSNLENLKKVRVEKLVTIKATNYLWIYEIM